MENQSLVPENLSIQNVEECLKYQSKLTETVYYNVCNGTQSTVPLGFWDYSLILFVVVLMAFMVVGLYKMIRS